MNSTGVLLREMKEKRRKANHSNVYYQRIKEIKARYQSKESKKIKGEIKARNQRKQREKSKQRIKENEVKINQSAKADIKAEDVKNTSPKSKQVIKVISTEALGPNQRI